jgi:hypothetical protein
MDYQSIQAAVDAASAGDTVLVHPGTYTLTSPIVNKAGVALLGTSPRECIIEFDGDDTLKWAMVMADDVTLENLTVNNTDTTHDAQTALANGAAERVKVHRCKLSARSYCLDTGNDWDVSDNDLSAPNAVLVIGNNVRVTDNRIHYVGAPVGTCFAPFDSNTMGTGCILAENDCYLESNATTGTAYWFIVTGSGNTIANNRITVFLNHASTTAADNFALIQIPGTSPSTTPNVVSGNVLTFRRLDGHAGDKASFAGLGSVGFMEIGDVVFSNNTMRYLSVVPPAALYRIYWDVGYEPTGGTITVHPGGMAGTEAASDSIPPNSATLVDRNPVVRLFDGEASVICTSNDTYVAASYPLVVPAKCILRGLLIESGAPAGTTTGTRTIQYAVGTVENANLDLTDATDYDVMAATAELTAANVHGDLAAEHTAAYFPMLDHGHYFAVATTLQLNFLGKCSSGSGEDKTVTAAIKVYAVLDRLA